MSFKCRNQQNKKGFQTSDLFCSKVHRIIEFSNYLKKEENLPKNNNKNFNDYNNNDNNDYNNNDNNVIIVKESIMLQIKSK